MLRSLAIVPPGSGTRALALEVVDAARHVRAPSARDSVSLEDYVQAAIDWYEDAGNRSLITASWVATWDGFPGELDDERCGAHWERRADRYAIFLPKSPVTAVASIEYRDAAGDWQTLDEDLYEVAAGGEPRVVTPVFGSAWPVTIQQPGCVRVTFAAGYGTSAAAVPGKQKQVLRLVVQHYFDQGRGPVVTGTIVNEMPVQGLKTAFWNAAAPRAAA